MIIKDRKDLEIKCEPCSSIEEGEEIAAKLLKELTESKTGIGLAANQIGINKRVCVINVKEPIVLINPEIVEKSDDMFAFMEGCLSFDNKIVKTSRHKSITVKADNHKGKLHFGVWSENNEDGYNKDKYLQLAYETACVQHEIDHLDGITMFDRELKGITIKRRDKKIGRNDKVTITKGSESKVLKYKKAEPMLEDGWTLSTQ
jgi:peptide deformylase